MNMYSERRSFEVPRISSGSISRTRRRVKRFGIKNFTQREKVRDLLVIGARTSETWSIMVIKTHHHGTAYVYGSTDLLSHGPVALIYITV